MRSLNSRLAKIEPVVQARLEAERAAAVRAMVDWVETHSPAEQRAYEAWLLWRLAGHPPDDAPSADALALALQVDDAMPAELLLRYKRTLRTELT
jgi:hypothetical protein